MSKIGKKLILSYFSMVVILSVVILSIIRVSFVNDLNQRIIEGIKNDAHNISAQIESDLQIFENLDKNKDGGTVRDVFPSDAAFKYSVRFASTNIFILNQNRKLIYESWKDDVDFSQVINSNSDEKKYFAYESEIKNTNKETIGYVITMAKKEDVGSINSMLTTASIIGVSISLIIATILAFIFESFITNPIKKLKRNINGFELSAEGNDWIKINSKDEIADLNEDFRKMTMNLVKYDRQQKEFFQNSSHELKTPLMSIRSYAEAIKDGIVNENEVDKFLDIIIDESNKLNQIVNNIMYISKIDTNQSNSYEKINLNEIIEDIKLRFSVYEVEKNIEITTDINQDINFRIREEEFFMMMSNLVSNAIRYAKSQIIISLFEDVEKIEIRVEDDGDGFNKEELPRVFDRFFKGDKGLSGLGLSIVKSLTEKNGGRVFAYNNDTGGATIKIIFEKK